MPPPVALGYSAISPENGRIFTAILTQREQYKIVFIDKIR
jgi:hypothetical protein